METNLYLNNIMNYEYKKELNDLSQLEKMIIYQIENLVSGKVHTKQIFNLIKDVYQQITISEDDIKILLDHLAKKEEELKKSDIILRVCPICNSNITVLKCQKCGGYHIKEVNKIIHTCGYADEVDSFISQDGLKCPGCGEYFAIGKDGEKNEYRISDTIYECMDCGTAVNKYNDLNNDLECETCKIIYRKTQTQFIAIYNINKTK